jgi:hypothetical protein
MSVLSDMSIAILACSIYLGNFFPFFHFKPVFIFAGEVHFLQATNGWILFFNPIH